MNNDQHRWLDMIDNYVSICKRNKKLVECRRPKKSIYRRYKEYLQMIQKIFADDTGHLPEETTIRDREFAYTTACLVEGQFFVCGTSLCLFSRVFFGTSLCLFSTCIFLQPWQKCIYLSLPPPVSVPGGYCFQWIVREKNQPHTSANATA